MQGFQLTFFTQQDRRHGGKPLGEWLVEEARRQGIGGATLLTGAEGFGHGGKIHSAHFFELADQPVEVTLALSVAEAERFLASLGKAGVKVFYVKTPIEYGTTGESEC